MLNKLLRAFITILGTMAIPGLLMLVQAMYQYVGEGDIFDGLPSWMPIVAYTLAGISSAAIFYCLSKGLAALIERGVTNLETTLREQPSMALLAGGIGLIIGLIVAALFSVILSLIPLAWVSVPLTIICYIIFCYLGVSIGMERRDDMSTYFTKLFDKDRREDQAVVHPKILDSSVLIDGRIFDVVATGVFDGEIVVPTFVLAELHRIAASDDAVKRGRGRRGLDLVGRMQKELAQPVTVSDKDYPDAGSTQEKLIRAARDMRGKLVTDDYGLNKVARVQGIEVFNVNELANALKPALTAGEEVSVAIVKTGRERGQGIAYLDDGTMIVVEDAASHVREQIRVVVTSVLQTPAGRMIFAKRVAE